MKKWKLRLWNGFQSTTSIIEAESYDKARHLAGVSGYPPAYIWSIEPCD